jgi:hydrogenase maturation factor
LACVAPDAADRVLNQFKAAGFSYARAIGHMAKRKGVDATVQIQT